MRKIWLVLVLLIIQWTFTINPDCIAVTDLDTIKNLFLTLERGYEERDIEKYMSVFSDEEYEYISDMTTPDDPSDDIRFTNAQDERRSAMRVFAHYENLDLEITNYKFKINNPFAEVRNQIRIVFVVLEGGGFPEVYYAVVNNVFNLRKFGGSWKIVKWQQNELAGENPASWIQDENKGKSIDDLIRELGDANMVKWAMAMSDLRKAGDAAMPSLIRAIKSSNKNLRIHAAYVLAGTRNQDAIQELMKILKNKIEDVDVQIASANALSQCEGQGIEDQFLAVVQSGRPKVIAATLLALAKRNKRKTLELYQLATAETGHFDQIVRKAAVESMSIMTLVPENVALEKRFSYKNESVEVRLAAMESLKEAKSAQHLFIDALKDKSEPVEIRSEAARLLGEVKCTQGLDLLMDVAKDKKETVEIRKAAVSGLGAMGSSKSTKLLINFLDSQDATLRHEAVKSLELLADGRALKPLMMVLMNKDEKDWIRRLAGRGAVKIDKDIAFGPLTQIIKDKTESAPARRMAAEELVSSGNEKSILVFADVLKDKQHPWWLRRIAVNSLVQLESCSAPSSPCADALKIAISDPDERVANAAREALAIKPGLLSKNQ